MLILTETGFQVHYDHYEVGLSDNDFLPVTNKAGESYRIWPWYSSEPRTDWVWGLNLSKGRFDRENPPRKNAAGSPI